MFKEATKMQQTKTGDWMPNGAMKSDFWERAECVFVCVSKTAYRFLFPWMRDGCRVTVSNLVKKPHTSQSLIEECLTGSSNNSRLFLGNVWKKMKNGLNGFSDFQTFKNLLLIYFHIKKKKVCIPSLLLLALKHCVTMEMGIFCSPRTVQHQNCL